jgi:hypothetical protein
MDKDDILAESRKENRNRDLYEATVYQGASRIGVAVACGLALIFCFVHLALGQGINGGFFSIALSFPAVMWLVRAFRMKHREIPLAIGFAILVLLNSVLYIWNLSTTLS